MQTKRNIFTLRAMVVVLLLMITMTSVATAADKSRTEAGTNTNTSWATYTDPRFDFTLEYPSHWVLQHRDDRRLDALGGTVVFMNRLPPKV